MDQNLSSSNCSSNLSIPIKFNISSLSTKTSSTTTTTTTHTSTNPSTIPYILNGEFYEILSQVGESVTVRCCKCPGENIYKGSVKSTGNFHMHIKRKHSEYLARVHEMKLKSFGEKKIKMPQQNKRQLYRKKLIDFAKTSDDQLPYNMQLTPIDYRKKQKIMDNNMKKIKTATLTKQNDVTKLCRISEQSNNDLLPNSNPPPAHQHQTNLNSAEMMIKFPTEIPVQENIKLIETPIVIESSPVNQHQQQHVSITPLTTSLVKTTSNTTIPGHDILLRVENHLMEIEREMRLRNQIESNRIFLELAKFKFLHPNFTLQN